MAPSRLLSMSLWDRLGFENYLMPRSIGRQLVTITVRHGFQITLEWFGAPGEASPTEMSAACVARVPFQQYEMLRLFQCGYICSG